MRLRLGAVGHRMLRHIRLSVWSLAFASLPVLAAIVWPTDVDASAACTAVCAGDLAAAVPCGLLVATQVAALVHRPAAATLAIALAACSFW